MTCPECTTRRKHVADSEALLADKRFKYKVLLEMGPFCRARLRGSYEHQLAQARESLAHHERECAEARR